MIQVNVLSFLMLFSAVISLLLTMYVYKLRKSPAMFNLLLLLAAITVWTLGYGFELAATNLKYMKLFAVLAYLGIATVPVLWLQFVARYSGNDGWVTPFSTTLLFFVPVISIVFVATNDLHFLFYSAYEMGHSGRFTFPKTDVGMLWWVHIVYSYLAILAGLWLLGDMYSKVVRNNRFPVGMFIAGLLIPFIANVAYVSGFKPYGFLDITPIVFIAMAVILIYGYATKKAINVTPLAYDLLFSNIPDSIFVFDMQGRIVNTNPAAQKMLDDGLSFVSEGDIDPSVQLFDVQNLLAQSDGSEIDLGERTYTVSSTSILSPGSKVFGQLIVLHDVTDRKIIEHQLEQLSFNDQLTGIYNRRFFENELMRLDRSREHPIALISIDLDGLKQINDTLGHAEGDCYLKAGATLLKNTLRASDILARMGGDEFALLLPRTSEADAQSFINRVRQEIAVYNCDNDHQPLRISLGLSISNSPNFPLEKAYRIADQNMYKDKSQKDKRNQ